MQLSKTHKASIITISDRCFAGQTIDKSGPALVELVGVLFEIQKTVLVPDEIASIQKAIKECRKDCQLIITSGGTGFSQRDVTPEAVTPMVCNGQ